MSLPRPVIHGQTLLITRRCSERRFFLRPSNDVNQILEYCLAVAALKYRMSIHFYCFLSNHWHIELTDADGNYPEFCRWFHEFSAKCINVVLGRWENVWATEQTSVVALLDEETQIDKGVYTLCNPVAAALVSNGDQWPGARSCIQRFDKPRVVKRPKIYFSPDGPLPESIELHLHKIPALAHLSDEQYVKRIDKAVKQREAVLCTQIRAEGRTFMGRRTVLRQSPFDKPKTHEPRREISPRIACRNKWARIEALNRIKSFIDSYKDALQRYKDGWRDTVFPSGTYWMRIYANVTCAPG